MRVRVRQHPLGGTWYVESKLWWQLTWQYVESFMYDGAFERAKAYAERLANPVIVEVK